MPEPELLTSAASIKERSGYPGCRDRTRTTCQGIFPVLEAFTGKICKKDGSLDPALAKEALGRAGVNESDRLLVYGDSG